MGKLVGWAMLFVIMYWALTVGASIRYFIDTGNVIFVLGIVVAGLFAAFGPKQTITSLFKRHGHDEASLYVQSLVIARGYQLSWAAGILGTFVSMIVMLQNMDDPSKIGPGIAVAMLTMLYGAVLAELVFQQPVQLPTDADSSQREPVKPKSMLMTGSAVVMLMISIYLIQWLAGAEYKSEINQEEYAEIKTMFDAKMNLSRNDAADRLSQNENPSTPLD